MSRLRTFIRLVLALVVVVGGGGVLAYQMGIIAEPSATVQDQAQWVTEPTPGVETRYRITNPNPFGLPNETLFVQYHVQFNRVTVAKSPRHAVEAPPGNTSKTIRADFRSDTIPVWWVSHVKQGEQSTRNVQLNVSGKFGPINASFPAVKSNKSFQTNVSGMVAASLEESEGRYSIIAGRETPAIEIRDTAVEWGNASTDSTPLRLTVEVHNPSPTAQRVPGMFGSLKMNGVEMTRWNKTGTDAEGAPEDGLIEPGETLELTYVVDVHPSRAEPWFERIAAGADEVTYSVDLGYVVTSRGSLRARPGPVGIRCGGTQEMNALGEDPTREISFDGCGKRPIPDRDDNVFVGPPGDINVSPESLSYTDAKVGETSTKKLIVTNTGKGPLRVRRAEVVSQSPGYEVEGNRTFTLAPGESRIVEVSFTPESTDASSGILHIVSDDPDEPEKTVWLSNTGIEASVNLNRTDDTTQMDVAVRNASAGTNVAVNIPQREQQADEPNETIQVQQISLTPEKSGEFDLNVTSSEKPLDDAPAFNLSDGTEGLAYMDVEHSISNDDIDEASFTFRVSKDKINESEAGSEPEDVSMYRNVDGEWQQVPTEMIRETENYYVFRTNTTGLSEWTAGSQRPQMSIANANIVVEEEVQPGEFVKIDVQIENTGGSDGVFNTRLLLDGEVVDEKQRTVPEGGTIEVVFNRSFQRAGTYTVEVNDVFVEEIEVASGGLTGPGGPGILVPAVGAAGIILLVAFVGWRVKRWFGSSEADADTEETEDSGPDGSGVDVMEQRPDFDGDDEEPGTEDDTDGDTESEGADEDGGDAAEAEDEDGGDGEDPDSSDDSEETGSDGDEEADP